MESLATLRERLSRIKESTPIAVQNATRVLDAMEVHQLEASSIDIHQGVLRIGWLGGYNQGRVIHMLFTDTGSVGCIASENMFVVKLWNVAGLTNHNGFNLSLPLDETLEYIRHFIWANHGV